MLIPIVNLWFWFELLFLAGKDKGNRYDVEPEEPPEPLENSAMIEETFQGTECPACGQPVTEADTVCPSCELALR